ncbi:MAG: hypothetical protein JRJ43_10140 [Deltaproteobacteria bacterium]|nr:hypothetical protein [Deltaproteobacteria bacterium]
MVEFIPRDFSGVMVFENGIWTDAGEIIGNVPYHSMYNDFTIKGSLKIEGVRENLQWKDAQVTREFDVLITDTYNNPIEGVCLKIEGTTYLSDNVGKAKFSLIFNENTYDQPKNLEISVGGSLIASEEIDFFTETPIRILTSPTIIPILDIKANNSDGPIILNQSETLTVSVALDNNGIIVAADFWLAAYNPFGVFFLTFDGWTTDWVPAYQGPLFYFPVVDLLTIPTSGLPTGSYWFYFAVDENMDGLLDATYLDSVLVTIQGETCTHPSGYIYDGSYPFGQNVPIPQATITMNRQVVYSDDSGYFSINSVYDFDPTLVISAPGFHDYREKLSRSVNGAFYLIPSGQVYNDFAILTWNHAPNNTANWHRKWDRQTEFYIVKNEATDQQINTLINILNKDEYAKMTGGLYHSNTNIHILASDPNWSSKEKKGKTKICFARGIISGGIAHSEDGGDGIINYAEIGWDTSQDIDNNCVWHELSHTVTAGGHINYRKSVNSETMGGGQVFLEDEKVFNCIYNSPPKRDN